MKKKIFIMLAMAALFNVNVMAETISSIEERGGWVYLYNAKGAKYKSLSASGVGKVLGYSATFFVAESGSWLYLYDAEGKRYKSMPKSSVGEVTGVAGDSFTSRSGGWIYTWSKEGKKINSRPAR